MVRRASNGQSLGKRRILPRHAYNFKPVAQRTRNYFSPLQQRWGPFVGGVVNLSSRNLGIIDNGQEQMRCVH